MAKPVSNIGRFIESNKDLQQLRERDFSGFLLKLSQVYDNKKGAE